VTGKDSESAKRPCDKSGKTEFSDHPPSSVSMLGKLINERRAVRLCRTLESTGFALKPKADIAFTSANDPKQPALIWINMRRGTVHQVHGVLGHPCAPVSPSARELTEDATMSTMSRVKQASKRKRTTNAAAMKALGAAGLGLSLAGSASASAIPTAGIPKSDNISPNQRFVLSEEEMADVSLATFHLFDKENAGSDMQLAVVVRGCRGCRVGGCRGCRVGACRVGGCGGCRVGGCGVGWGCGGCGVGVGGCCASWGACRIC
jgi:hypothetical protein